MNIRGGLVFIYAKFIWLVCLKWTTQKDYFAGIYALKLACKNNELFSVFRSTFLVKKNIERGDLFYHYALFRITYC